MLLRRWARRIFWKSSFNIPRKIQDVYIETAEGLIEESLMEKQQVREITPAGFSYTTAYYFQGRLVRQDSTQEVIHGLAIQGQTGQTPHQQ